MDSNTARKIKSKDTSIELILRKELWKRGYRYRVNDRKVFGKPDIVFSRRKVAIFCDSEFWHGEKYLLGERFKTNSDFWESKIKGNIKRDKEVNDRLKSEGWTVIRFWDKEIKENSDKCINKVISFLRGKRDE
ncbi:MAG: very short patch repair endonuclease [Deltaproteobacteria bacterium]|nr:very short patch repair endonuclease [Deltaproteobacteria bacterium]MCL5891905.1 very short patch repair endonuclease [Deltaproteobacteria bacterium]